MPINFIIKNLACPYDKTTLEINTGKLFCPKCNRVVGLVDQNSIISLESKDYYFREVPKHYLKWLVERDHILDDFFNSTLDNSNVAEAASYAMNSNRAVALFETSLSPNSLVLDFGCGWGTISRCSANFSKATIAMDLTYLSQLFSSRISKNNLIHIHGGDGTFLPFKNDFFDLIILNGVLEWIPESISNFPPQQAQINFLKEIRRILKKDGEVLIGIENRLSILYLMGQKEDHTNMRFISLMPRFFANFYRKLLFNKPYKNYTYSHYGLRKILNIAGFKDTKIYWPWWIYRVPWHIFPFQGDNYLDPNALKNAVSTRHKIANILLLLFAKINIFRFFVPSFYIRGGKTELKETFLDEMIKSIGDEEVTNNKGIYSTASKCLVCFGSNNSYKFALDSIHDNMIMQEYENAMFIKKIPSLSSYIPEVQIKSYREHPVLIMPIMKPITDLSEEMINKVDIFLKILGKLPRCYESFRNVIQTNVMDHFLRLTDLRGDWEKILEILGDYKIELGAVHGDFHIQQLYYHDGRLKVSDWERFSLKGIYGIDHWSFSMHYWQRETKLSWIELWQERLFHSNKNKIFGDHQIGENSYNIAAAVGFVLQTIIENVKKVDHPIELNFKETSKIINIIKKLRHVLDH